MNRATVLLMAAGLMAVPAMAVQACSEQDLDGPYGLQLAGNTTISSTSAPAALLSRLVFDGEGVVDGYSSVNFNGLLLGNPVTGDYEVSKDCTLTLNLRDDSGGWQHFNGKLSGGKAELEQTDPNTGIRGPLRKAPESCSAADFRQRYDYTLSGTLTTLVTGGAPAPVSDEGRINTTGAGTFQFTGKNSQGSGTFDVGGDCMMTLELNPEAAGPMALRGIIVEGGQEILAIQTDPGQSVAARLRAR